MHAYPLAWKMDVSGCLLSRPCICGRIKKIVAGVPVNLRDQGSQSTGGVDTIVEIKNASQ
jgi:hypothetical protein